MPDSFPVFRTERLLLRHIERSDLFNIYKGLSNPDVTRFYGVSFSTLKSTEEQMDWYHGLEKNNTGIWWAICLLNENKFIGAIGFNDILKSHRKGEIGFWIYPEYWRKGYVSEAMPKVLEYGFNGLGLHRIEGVVESGNHRSNSLLKKVGFAHEGTMQDSEIKNGNFISLEVYALISPK